MAVSDILKVVPTIQATALVGEAVKFGKKKKKKAKDFIDFGATAIVGSAFIQEESKLINSI